MTTTNNFHLATLLKDVKKGDLVRLRKDGGVYIRGDYDRETKRYELTKWDNASAASYYRGDRTVYIGFTF